MRLSDAIEQFIKTMLTQEAPEVELKRNELAEYFNCAPSQINYVLATRFTPDHGYIIESRRGGGGYIRIFRMTQDTSEHLLYLLHERVGDSIDALAASHLVQQLRERELVTDGEAAMMNAALSPQALSLPLPAEMKDALRARILKNMLLEVARKAIHTEMLSLKRMEDTLGDEFATAVEMILGSRGKCIVTGMGKSGLVGRKIAATLASTGTPSFFLHPGEAFHGDLGMISKEDIVVALSYSGETDEILKIVPFIHSNGNKLVSMTGNPDSALAKNSDVHLDVGVKEEACILHLAPTSSTTAQIAMGDALAVSLMQMRGFTSVDFARLHPGGSLGRRLLMTVGNVMRDHDLPVVAPDCPAAEMIHAISKGGLGLIVICEGERIEGIVTDGDVRRAMERLRGEFFNIRASDIATRNPKTISPDEKLIEAEKMMTRNKVTSLLVTDAAGKLTGVIQIYDIKL